MSRDDDWLFLTLGRALERADVITRQLAASDIRAAARAHSLTCCFPAAATSRICGAPTESSTRHGWPTSCCATRVSPGPRSPH